MSGQSDKNKGKKMERDERHESPEESGMTSRSHQHQRGSTEVTANSAPGASYQGSGFKEDLEKALEQLTHQEWDPKVYGDPLMRQ